ncbi:unnamed protein product [Kuraishia capsulata CBS 1993]|uniref:MAGE domain-containing protein n=1 Tax=Kuraishia capsulata CBS 1993 TaxID=1382522 RepID=W6MVA9_9ASCO|nr:uncharacterized protein KUCA_T00002151001 [Kuraishia capsulata CBS 1993]CDK26180.1 unnamed protein product [Kuraishia capsulata CBS 1993]
MRRPTATRRRAQSESEEEDAGSSGDEHYQSSREGPSDVDVRREELTKKYGEQVAALVVDKRMKAEQVEGVLGWSFKFARVLIGVENRHQVITRSGVIQKVFEAEKGTRPLMKWQTILPFLQAILHDTFGLELVALPKKNTTTTTTNKKQKRTNGQAQAETSSSQVSYILVNIIPEEMKDIISKIFEAGIQESKSVADLEVADSVGKIVVPSPVTDTVESGFKALIICIIALHENHITKNELFQILEEQFKISTHQTTVYDFLSRCNMDEFMSLMDRQEYIVQSVTKSANARNQTGDFVEYSLGRRAVAEFGKAEMMRFIEGIYGESWDEDNVKAAEFTFLQVFKETAPSPDTVV